MVVSHRLLPNLAGRTLDSAEFWRGNASGGWVTAVVLLLIAVWKLLVAFSRWRGLRSRDSSWGSNTTPLINPSPSTGISRIITDEDLRELIKDFDVKNEKREKWENVIEKKNGLLSYNAKCCRTQDGPLKYLSITIFEKCSTDLLRDFYMDNEYRKEWDKTLIEYKQLQVDDASGTEIGCMIKKFPFMTPREYILAWCVWEGKDKTFYCVIKHCEHSLAPRQKKYVRVGFFRSGWRIRKVPGRDACEVTMVHQENAGMNVEMAKLAFAKGIWSYVCKMNKALRDYSSGSRSRSSSVATMLRIIKKVPPEMETGADGEVLSDIASSTTLGRQVNGSLASGRRLWEKPSMKQLIANGLLLVGGIACLSRGRTTLGTQLAMACILKKLMKRGPALQSSEDESAPVSRARQERTQRDWPRHRD